MSDYCIMLIVDTFGPVCSTVAVLYNEAPPLIEAAIFFLRLFISFFFFSSVEMV